MVVTLTEPREAGGVPGKSSLFFFTVTRLFSCRPSRFGSFSFFFFCSLSAVSRKGGGGRSVKKRERGGWVYTFGLANCFSIPGIRLSGERER